MEDRNQKLLKETLELYKEKDIAIKIDDLVNELPQSEKDKEIE